MKRLGQAAIGLILCVITLNCVGYAQGIQERKSILSAFAVSYGEPTDAPNSVFQLSTNYLLTLHFSDDGTLTKISIAPKYEFGSKKSPSIPQLEFEKILATLNSIKPLGAFEEGFPAIFVSGGRGCGQKRYENGYLETAEPITEQPPRSVATAEILYLYSVTGYGRVPKASKPKEAGSFGLVCFNGKSYIAPQSEFLKLYENPGVELTLRLAGPTGDMSSVCTN